MKTINPFESAMEQLEKAARFVEASMRQRVNASGKTIQQKLEILKQPQRILNVTIPVVMDDGRLQIFQGYRVQFNNALGP